MFKELGLRLMKITSNIKANNLTTFATMEKFHLGNDLKFLNNLGKAANFTGILACSTYKEIMNNMSCFNSSAKYCLLDSCASNHMSYNRKFLTNTRPLPYPF